MAAPCNCSIPSTLFRLRSRAQSFFYSRPFAGAAPGSFARPAISHLPGHAFSPSHSLASSFCLWPTATVAAAAVAVVIALVLVTTAIFFAFFYLFARLQFAFFDIVLNRGEFVVPAWRKYGSQTWQWVGFSVALGTFMIAVMAAPCISYARNFFTQLESLKSLGPGQPPPIGIIVGFYTGYFLLCGLLLLMMLVCTTISDSHRPIACGSS